MMGLNVRCVVWYRRHLFKRGHDKKGKSQSVTGRTTYHTNPKEYAFACKRRVSYASKIYTRIYTTHYVHIIYIDITLYIHTYHIIIHELGFVASE